MMQEVPWKITDEEDMSTQFWGWGKRTMVDKRHRREERKKKSRKRVKIVIIVFIKHEQHSEKY